MTEGDEPIYEPLAQKRRRGAAADRAEDASGQLVEYEHGYLRMQAKAKRGVLKAQAQARVARRAAPFLPPVVPDCGTLILIVLEVGRLHAAHAGTLPVELWWRDASNPKSPLRALTVTRETSVPTEVEQRLLRFLHPHQDRSPGAQGNRFLVPLEKQGALWGLLEELPPAQLRWSMRQEERPWRLHRLALSPFPSSPWGAQLREDGRLELFVQTASGDISAREWQACGASGWVMAGDCLHRIALHHAFPLLAQQIGKEPFLRTERELREAVRLLTQDGGADLSRVPAQLHCEVAEVRPHGRLYISPARFKHLGKEQLQAELSFDYAGMVCAEQAPGERLSAPGMVLQRQPEAEEALREELRQAGFRLVTRQGGDEDPGWKLLPAQLDAAVRKLVLDGWEITAEGKSYRRPVNKGFAVAASASGVDWLEVNAVLDFDGHAPALPELLQAVARGRKSVKLDDGTYGILPQEWLEHFTVLLEIGECRGEKLLVRQQHAMMLDILLKEELEDRDGRYRAVLQKFQADTGGASSAAAASSVLPATFRATLRPYQQLAFQWLRCMAQLGLGAILADDMGLGKTVEILALLEARRQEAPGAPFLVVVPSSLLFNWKEEASRFAPQMRVGVYYGSGRDASPEWFRRFDLVLTTYGTLRQDITRLAAIRFDYAVLDEAQAIKNADSAAAQSVRMLQANHRIAMTGTPIENHIGELFSQLAFLNPGLFTAAFVKRLAQERALLASSAACERLRRFLQPFFLRRRKEQVAKELPPKSAQVLWCELEEPQRRQYDELRDYYRMQFQAGGGRPPQMASMLSALLRLRQAACHPALLRAEEPSTAQAEQSAKLTLLLEQLRTLQEGGHKALVFSQFTRFLKLVAKACEAEAWPYCYLDGETKERGALVRRFQEEEGTRLFLISLKAGGVGLNLTAADYVFLLDPWWNPAAEEQAIDRAYRIGQTRPVFAYRLITRGTIEEKVAEMQERKRRLAASVLERPGMSPEAPPPSLSSEELFALLQG